MDPALTQLYRELGFEGQIPEAGRRPRSIDPRQPGSQESTAAELPPLAEENLQIVERELKDQEEETLRRIRDGFNYPLSDEEIREALNQARHAFDRPAEFVEELQKRNRTLEEADRRSRGILPGDQQPLDLTAELKRYPDIFVAPSLTRYEPKADALAWVFNSGVQWMRDKLKIGYEKARFPSHKKFNSGFSYRMKNPAGNPIASGEKVAIALFGDFGGGLYHSHFIARKIAEMQPDYAIHLGDVYFSGRRTEFDKNMKEPLAPVMKTSRFFTMNANHEMYSGAFPYFNFINHNRNRRAGWVEQEQEGSYFCIWSDRYQVIGIDTAYHEDGRYRNRELRQWLKRMLRQGKNATPVRTNILLSPNEPYELGELETKPLFEDLQDSIDDNLIDYWFWGNTHYAALFEKTKWLPFTGSCAGHGGFPIYKKDIEQAVERHEHHLAQNKKVAPFHWVELGTRFPEASGIRPDMGSNGFCMMELDSGGVSLTYYDWLGRTRYEWSSR